MILRSLPLLLVVLLPGCGFLGLWDDEITAAEAGEPSLAEWLGDAAPAAPAAPEEGAEPDTGVTEPGAGITYTRATIAAQYAQVEALASTVGDEELQGLVAHRLANLTLLQALDETDPDVRDETLGAALDRLLALGPAVRYQSAQAAALLGRGDVELSALEEVAAAHEEAALRAEAEFRLGENAFTNGAWAEAQDHYEAALAQAPTGWLRTNSAYMLGWTRLKLLRYGDAWGALAEALDSVLLPPDAETPRAVDDLPRSDRELLDDTRRALLLSLGETAPVATLGERIVAAGLERHASLLHEDLVNRFVGLERFADAVAASKGYLALAPLAEDAEAFSARIIALWETAGFPGSAWEAREQYVLDYGPDGAYAQRHGLDRQAERLLSFLDQLSQRDHYAAQESGEPADFASAADWYEQYARVQELVGTREGTALALFRAGEMRLEAQTPELAQAHFRRVFREFPEAPEAQEAGVALFLVLDQGPDPTPERLAELEAIAIDFTTAHSDDDRGTPMLARVLDLGRDAEPTVVIERAERLLARPDVDAWPDSRHMARDLLAHAHFDLGDFAVAEALYADLLADPALDATLRDGYENRRIVSIQRQAQLAEASARAAAQGTEEGEALAPDFEQALFHLQRLAAVGGEVGVGARRDAIALLLESGAQGAAIAAIEAYRAEIGRDEAWRDLSLALAGLYEGTEAWPEAAELWQELLDAGAFEGDPDASREALYAVASAWDHAGRLEPARDAWRRYAHDYEFPVGPRAEAMNRLQEIYAQWDDDASRSFWLVRLADLPVEDARVATLASRAATALAQQASARFEAVELRGALKQALARKQKVYREALEAWRKVREINVLDDQSTARLGLAQVHAGFARSLRQAPVPDGLNEAQRMRYAQLVEQQAAPFHEAAVEQLLNNIGQVSEGLWDQAIADSVGLLERLEPLRYGPVERGLAYVPS